MSKFVLTAQLQLQAPTNTAQVVSQIQRQLSGINVNVQYKQAAQAKSAVDGLTDSVESAKTSATGLGKAFGVSVKRFTALAIATRAVSLFTNKLGGAVQESIAFERELIKISQVTGNLISDLRFLTNEITNLSTSLGVSSSELLSVSRILSQAGLDAREVTTALSALAKTDLAPTFDNMTQTAEGAVAIFNQFKQGASALEAQLGSLNAVAGQFAVESGDLISVIRRTGGVFRQAGGDLNELVALFTSVRSTTRESAESIATGLRTIFTRIQRPQTIEYLKQFGVELVDSQGKFIGLYKAVGELNKALSGLEEGDLTFIQIAEQLGGFRQIGKVLPLIKEYAVAQRALQVAQEGSNSLAEDASRAQASLAVRILKVREEFLALIRSVSETRTFQIMANSALSLASAFIKIAEAVKPLLPLLAAVATFRLAKGIVGFAGNAINAIQGKNQGGVIQKFATGGYVPGTGNRDTVPAMLTPGEFVIRKSSVAKIGANNLAAMNRGGSIQKFAAGGKTRRGRPVAEADYELTEEVGQLAAYPGSAVSPGKDKGTFGITAKSLAKHSEDAQDAIDYGEVRPNETVRVGGTVNSMLLGPEGGKAFGASQWLDSGLGSIDKKVNASLGKLGLGSSKSSLKDDEAVRQKVEGFTLESFISGLLGKAAEGGKEAFDFKGDFSSQLGSDLTITGKPPRYLDAKRTLLSRGEIIKKGIDDVDVDVVEKFADGGLVQKFADGGLVKNRKVGYIDYDAIANPANEAVVKQGMGETGVTGPRLYADFLSQLAVKARKSQTLEKLTSIFGVAGSGKTTLAKGQGTDDATLRKTERFPILSPKDIEKATEVIVLSSSVSKSKLDEVFEPSDRTYTLSSTTEKEKARVKSQRLSRDETGVGLEGRKPGTTIKAEDDTAVGEALLADRLGDKSVVLARKESGGVRAKRPEELVEVIKKKIGFTWGGFSPITAGHESIMDAASAMGIPPKDFFYLVGSNEAIKGSDPSSYRTAIFDQDARMLLAQAGPGSAGANVLPKSKSFEVPQAFDVSKGGDKRQVVVPEEGSTAFVADKTAGQTAKYKESGYDVQNLERTGGISGTQVRDLIMKGDMAQLQKVLSPNVYDLISNNIDKIQNRANALPEIIQSVKQKETASLADIQNQISQLGISRIDNKLVESDPEYAAKVEVLKELRGLRDKIKSAASFEPYSILAAMTKADPDKYGLDLRMSPAKAIPAIRTVTKKTKAAKASKFAIGGIVQRFKDGGEVESLSPYLQSILSISSPRKQQYQLKSYRELLVDRLNDAYEGITRQGLPAIDQDVTKKTKISTVLPNETVESTVDQLEKDLKYIEQNAPSKTISSRSIIYPGLKKKKGFDPGQMIDAMYAYQGLGMDIVVNKALAEKRTNETIGEFFDRIGKDSSDLENIKDINISQISSMLSAAAQYTPPKTLYSGLGKSKTKIILDAAKVTREGNIRDLIGKTFSMPSFLSTASEQELADNFAREGMLTIATNQNKKVSIPELAKSTTVDRTPISKRKKQNRFVSDKESRRFLDDFDSEDEFILPPNSKFKITYAQGDISRYLDLHVKQLNKGGQVQKFATGGIVPGTGNRDTVPAMLTPGEFVIRKSSVEKIGAHNLAAMNRGGEVQQFALGGEVQVGSAILKGRTATSSNITPQDIMSAASKEKKQYLTESGIIPNRNYELVKQPLSKQNFGSFDEAINQGLRQGLNAAAKILATTINVPTPAVPKAQEENFIRGLNDSAKGNLFESILSASMNKGTWEENPDPQRPFDIRGGMKIADNSGNLLFPALQNIDYVDAKATMEAASKENIARKIGNQLINESQGQENTQRFRKTSEISNQEIVETIRSKYSSPNSYDPRTPEGRIIKVAIDDGVISNAGGSGAKKRALDVAGIQYRNLGGVINKLQDGGKPEKQFGQIGFRSGTGDIMASYLGNKGRTGSVTAKPSGNGLYTVGLSRATKGYGPKLYDVVMEIATSHGSMLAPDRNMVSADAQKVWEYYFNNRGDVTKTPLPPEQWTKNQSLIDPKLYGQPHTWPPKTDPAWILQSGYKKQPSIIHDEKQAINLNDPKYDQFARMQQLDYLRKAGGGFISKKHEQKDVAHFASGGSAGSDTVPALLTPGEFVFSKQASQRIGYGALSRMNKVGKYAKGGIVGGVRRFQEGGGVFSTSPSESISLDYSFLDDFEIGIEDATGSINTLNTNLKVMAEEAEAAAESSNKTSESNDKLEKSGRKAEDGIYKTLLAMGAVTATLQQFRPTIEAGSTAFATGIAATVDAMQKLVIYSGYLTAAFQKLNVQLNAQNLAGLFKTGTDVRKSEDRQGFFYKASRQVTKASRSILRSFGVSSKASARFAGRLGAATRATGPFIAAMTAAYIGAKLFADFVKTTMNYEMVKKDAIERGDVETARSAARGQVGTESFSNMAGTAAAGGAAVGMAVGGPLGAAVGALVGTIAAAGYGIVRAFGPVGATMANLAAAQAGLVKADRDLADATKAATVAMKDFTDGNGTAADVVQSYGTAVNTVTTTLNDVESLKGRLGTDDFSERSTGFGAWARWFASWSGTVMTSEEYNNAQREGGQTARDANQRREDLIRSMDPGVNALIAQYAAAQSSAGNLSVDNISFDDIIAGQSDQVKEGETQSTKQILENYKALQTLGLTSDQAATAMKALEQKVKNIAKEIEKVRAYVRELNVGLKALVGSASAGSLALDNYMNRQKAGYLELDNSIRTLEASVTGAALGISQADFAGTMADVANQMSQLGASSQQIDKFVGSVSAINTAQSLSPQIATQLQATITAEVNKGIQGNTGPGAIKEKAISSVGSVLRGQGVDEASIRKITAGLNLKLKELTPEQQAKLQGGDISVITDALDEMGKEILQDVLPALKEKAEAEKKLIELTRARIDAENKYMEAQKKSQDIMLEAREIEAEAGGRPLNPSDRRQTILNKANIEGRLAGLSDMQTGDANDILRRNAEINARRTQLNAQRGMAAAGMSVPGMQGKSGAQLSGDLERLNKVAKDQWNVTKDLIAVKKQELDMIKAKNQLEKDSMDALISGDLEKWFDQQAAMGAQAAIATGDDRLIREYGISAVGMATQDMQRMADAGVDTLYGQKLRGPGGLIEKGYSEVAFATGLDMQSAQAAAGTTDRENQLNREIIDLSRTAPDTAMTQESFERDDVIIAGMQEVVAEHKYAAAVQMAAAKLQMAAAQSESLPKPSEDSQQAAGAAGAAGAKATYGLSEKTQNLVNSQMVLEEQKQKAIESGNKEEADALQKQIDSRQSDIEASRGIKSGQWWGNTSEAEKQRLMTDVELYKQNKRSPQPVQTQTPAPPIAVGAPMPPMMQQAQMQNTQEQTPLAQAAIMPQQPVFYGSVPQAAMNFGQTPLQSQQQNPVAQAVNPAAKIAFMAQTGRAPTVENMMGGGLSRGNTYVDPGREASTEFRRLSPEEQATRTKQVFDSAVANPHGAATATLQNNQRIAEQMGLGGFTAGMNQDPLAWMQQIPATAGSFSNVGIDPTSSGFGGGTKDAALSLFSGQLPQLEGQAMQQIPATAGSFSNAGIDPISSSFGGGAKLEGQAMQQIAQGVTMPFDNKGVTITPEFDPNQQGDSNTMSVSSLVVNAAKCYVNCASCEGSDKQGQPSQQMPQGYQLPQAPQLNQQSPVEAPNAPNAADQIYGPTGMTMAEAPMKIAEQAVKMPKGMNLSKLVQRIPASALPQAIKTARGAAPAARGLAQGARNFMSSTAQKFEAGRDMARIGVKPTKPNSLTTKIGYQYQNIGEQFKQGRQIGRANRLDPRKPFGTQNYVQKAGQVYDDAVANTRLGYQNLKAGYKGGRARGFDGRFMKGADSASFKAGQRARGVVDATKQAGSFVGRQAGNVGSFVGRQAGNVGSFVAGQARRIPGVQGVEKFATNQFKNAKAGYQNLKAGYSRYSPSTGVPQARGVDGRVMKAADSRAFQAGQRARRVTDSVAQGTKRFTGGLAARGSEFAQDFQRGRNFARMQRLEAANPAAKLKLLDSTQTLANTTDAFAPGPIEKNILNSKKATTLGEKAGKFADDAVNFVGKGVKAVPKQARSVLTQGAKLASRAAPAVKVAGKVAGKALGPLDLAIGGYTGYTQKDRDARAEYDEDGNLLSRNANDVALEQMGAAERTTFGALTGSATTGSSVTGSVLGLQQNGNADMALSGMEAVARGAMVGSAFGPVGTAVGAGVGGAAEVAKNVRQLEIDQAAKRDQMARTQKTSYALGEQRSNSLEKIREDIGLEKYSVKDNEYTTQNFEALPNQSAFEDLAETQSGALFDARNKAVLRRAQSVKDSGGTTADFTRGMNAEEADLYKDMSLDDIITEKQTRLAETKATRKKKRNDATYFGLSEAKNVDSERYQMGVEERANLFEKEFEARDAANEQIEREKAGMAPGEAGPLATQMPTEQKATNPSAMIEAMSLTGSTIDAGAANESEVMGPPDEGIQTKPLVQAQTQLVQQQAMQQPKTQELTGVGVGKEILGAFENTSAAQMYQDAQGGGLASDINKNAEVPKAGDSKESGDNAYFDSLLTRRRHPDLGQAAPTPAGAMQSAQNLPGAATVQDRGQHYMQSLSGMPDEGSKDAALSLFSGNLPMKSPETMSDSVDQMRTTMANNKTAVASSMQDLSRSATASASVGTESQARAVQTQNNQNAVTVQDQGGAGMGLDPQTIASLTEALNKFNSELASNIETLQNTTVKIQLEKTNIIVDIRGGAFFDKMKGELKQELLREVGNQLNKNSLDAAGKPSQSESQLGK